MYTLIIVGIALFFISWLYLYSEENDGAFATVIASVITMCAIVAAAIVLFIIGEVVANDNPEYSDRTDIVLMNDGSAVSGTFKFGTGEVKTDNVYRYYIRDANGAITTHDQMANDSLIFEDAESPYMLRFCEDNTVNTDWILTGSETLTACRYEFHIPEGSFVEGSVTLDGD